MTSEDEPTGSNPPSMPLHQLDGSGGGTRDQSSTIGSGGRIRSASLRFLESSPPSGMWSATGQTLAQAPTPLEIRRGSFGHHGWDGHIQRRNSTVSEESIRRLSRTSSAQTPGSLGRTATNLLDAHAEEEEGDHIGGAEAVKAPKEPFAPRPKDDKKRIENEDVGGEDFSKFIGRGKIEDQSYSPKATGESRTTTALKRRSADPYAIPDDDDDEDIDPLDEKPFKSKGLPKKFQDPSGDAVPVPGVKSEKPITPETIRESSSSGVEKEQGPNEDGVYPNGYKFPPKHTWGQATVIGLKAVWKFTITPFGFLVVIYGLNVVAWGGMLFLLLIGGGNQFMCYYPNSHGKKDCGNINSPRRIWIEIDSQILNALFCVTGFGLIPWRFRDFYYLLQWRLRRKQDALRRLAGIHRSWFRLPGSHDLPTDPHASIITPDTNPAIPLPPAKIPDNPLTGIRALGTKLWKMDYVVWAFVCNTFLQAVLSGFMWGYDRYTRPSWSTGTFVALACIVAGLGGLMQFQEGKRIKAVEGIPVDEAEMLKDVERDVKGGEKGRKEGGKGKVAKKEKKEKDGAIQEKGAP
ncbi:hypothetical protein ACLMJK_008861 [Lecanora helva]